MRAGALDRDGDSRFEAELRSQPATKRSRDERSFDEALEPDTNFDQELHDATPRQQRDLAAHVDFDLELAQPPAPTASDPAADVRFALELSKQPKPKRPHLYAVDVGFDAALQAQKKPAQPNADVDFEAELAHPGGKALAAGFGALMEKSPAFRQYIAARVAETAGATISHVPPPQKARDWQIDFGPASAPAGYRTTITIQPQCLFRGDKITATDTSSRPGYGTRVVQVLVGQRVQRPASGQHATLTAFFAVNALGNGVRWDTCERRMSISVTVSFIEACTFEMAVFGKCVVGG